MHRLCITIDDVSIPIWEVNALPSLVLQSMLFIRRSGVPRGWCPCFSFFAAFATQLQLQWHAKTFK
eukprot:4383465-Amphidinium_carterae.1